MSPEITSALIAAFVSVVGLVVTLIIGLRNLRLEKDKLQTERERIQTEINGISQQSHIRQAEVEKLREETRKLAYEADDIRRKRFEAEREEIRNLLLIFDRSVFDAPFHSEDPIQMFIAIRQIRIAMQTNGASLVKNRTVAESFQRIRKILLRTENEVMMKYPAIFQLATQPMEEHLYAAQLLGRDWEDSIYLMMGLRQEVDEQLRKIRKQLHILDKAIDQDPVYGER